ncbi:MAG: hypothetical protein KA362_06340, partial [Chloroflexi bacterium]|nr:hypothetical protein [Chloroflexota bacterium]
MSRFRAIILAIVAVSLLAACRQQDTAVSPTIAPTAAPVATDAPAAAVEDQAEPEPTSTDPAADVAAAPTDTPSPTATPLPPKDFVVCVAAEPTSLFLYGDNSLT